MLHPARGLTSADLDAIAGLEARTVAADGGRLKLEWSSLRSRTGQSVEDLLWWDGGELLGFLGIYAFGAPSVELGGMVDPAARRRGIGSALVDAAVTLCREREYHPVLLVVPGDTPSGRAFALSRNAIPDHSEYALRLDGPPAEGKTRSDIHLRAVTAADLGSIAAILEAGFGFAPPESDFEPETGGARTLAIDRGDVVVGTMRVRLDGDAGSVYGFAIDPSMQGRGIGREALRQACWQLLTRGATHIGLEVAVENDRALGLYTSLGFARMTTEDYYALPSEATPAVTPPT